MDRNGKNFNIVKSSSRNKPMASADSEKIELNRRTEEDNETESLLPARRGGLSKKSEKPRLKVQWNDKDGNNLAEVLEFQPSDVSDSSDDEDSDSCICVIM